MGTSVEEWGRGGREEGNVDDDTATESVLGSQQELF